MSTSHQHQRLQAPSSPNTVRIRMINTTSDMLLNTKVFIDPVPETHQKINMTDIAFLIENDHLNKKALFDLGVRKDFWNFPPASLDTIGKIAHGLRVEKDVPEILMEGGVNLESINDIIWSHSHFDHTGDPSLFPQTTTLNYGPEISSIIKPGYPTDKSSPHLSTNFTNRPNNEISFSSTTLRIGGFPAHDFYGDGSFYLLETPGHSQGHMCGLARTTTTTTTPTTSSKPGNDVESEDTTSTWILMGGDVCHFCGDMRPNTTYPLPTKSETNNNKNTITVPGLGEIPSDELLKTHPQFSDSPSSSSPPSSPDDTKTKKRREKTPFFTLPTSKYTGYTYPSPQIAQQTVNTLTKNFDEMENVFVMLAHDVTLVESKILPVFNEGYHDDNDSSSNGKKKKDLNDWFECGWKEELYWGWIRELKRKEEDNNKENNIVEGFWKGGVRYSTLEELLLDGGKGKL